MTAAPTPPGPTRRAVLTAGLAAPLAACTGSGPEPAPPPPPVDPDVALRAAAVERERALLAAYDGALAAGSGRAAVLRLLREEHAAHLSALDPAATPPGTPALDGSPGASPGRLRAAEREAAAAHAADALPASRGLAALLASLAAAEAAHLVALA